MPSIAYRKAQDEAAKVVSEIEALRALECENAAEATTRDDRLEELSKRSTELNVILDRERSLDAKVAALRSSVTDGCESRKAVEKPAVRELPRVGGLGGFESAEAARETGLFLRSLRDNREYRAMGETSTAYDGKGSEYVPIELYSTVINRIQYASVAMKVASVFNAMTNRLTLPKVGDASAAFVTDGTATTDQDISTSGVTVNVLEMRASVAVGNSLIDDSPIDVAALVAERLGLAYAKKIDDAWLSGDSGASIGGLYAGITSGNKVTVAANSRTTAANLASMIGMVDPFVSNTCWIVSATGWADLFNVAAGQIGTMVFGGTTPVPTIWGTPVFKVKGLPSNVLAVYGDFQFTSAVAIKPSGLQISAARELLIRQNATLFVGVQRIGVSNHAPEYASMIVKGT